jgi:ribosomal protein S18 acetylase RimI-like enzyme
MGEAIKRLASRASTLKYSIADGSFNGKPNAKRFVTVTDGGKVVGHLGWFTDPERKGEIFSVSVAAGHRRQGIASELFRRAQEDEPALRHSDALSDDAKAWIKGMARDGDGDGVVGDGTPNERPA